MRESTWLTTTTPSRLLEFTRSSSSDRKYRLFAVDCCRAVWHLLAEEASREAVLVSERHADGLADDDELAAARVAAGEAARRSWALWDEGQAQAMEAAAAAAGAATLEDALRVADYAGAAVLAESGEASAWRATQRRQCDVLRCLLPSPFRPLTLEPKVKTPGVVALARGLYEDRRFEELPVLGDALEEAGCTNEQLLSHCRWQGTHARGCWALDSILG
jgi:hypothetical protein